MAGIILGLFLLYKIYQFIKATAAFREAFLFPDAKEELEHKRKNPDKQIKEPSMKQHRGGFILFGTVLLFAMVMCTLELIFLEYGWMYTFLFLLPLFHS